MLKQIWDRLAERFAPQQLADALTAFLPNLVSAVVTFVVYWLIWKLLQRIVRSGARRLELDPTQTQFAQTVAKYVVLTMGVVSALGDIGINTTSILASLGVAGLTLGFAARDTLSNLISGIFIFWDRPFVIGDLVEVGDKYGRVEEITLRSTRVVTVDGKMIAVPNSNVVNSMVVSYTNFPHIRIEVDFTIAVDEDIDRVRHLFMEWVKSEEHWMGEPPPQMVVTAINDYNVAVQFRAWLADETRHISARFSMRKDVYKLLVEAGVEMPYETLSVETRAAA
jgi:small conductance mechanosensitive channel